PEGNAVRITNDIQGFGNMSVSVTADGSTIATVPWDIVSNLWATNADATAPLEQWTSGRRIDGNSGIAPRTDGGLYFASEDGTDVGIWSIDAAGARPRKLTREYAEVPSSPVVGRFVVYQAIHEGRFRIWRMQPDGSDPRVLTKGEDDIIPLVSPDGRWVYYMLGGAKRRLMRVAADGGESVVLSDLLVTPTDLSADGRDLLVMSEDKSIPTRFAILDAETGAIKRRVDVTGERVNFGRRPDLVAYIVERKGVDNLWEQPINGGPARQLTQFTSGRIFNFAYSVDRKRLILARGQRTGDVVLLRNFR
ncbi:MAG: hypothetical protein ABIS06_00265, partial [Vicinamibacterales bacterium]